MPDESIPLVVDPADMVLDALDKDTLLSPRLLCCLLTKGKSICTAGDGFGDSLVNRKTSFS
jgi:hypothetical protein